MDIIQYDICKMKQSLSETFREWQNVCCREMV
jgi:hypothetical protein